MSDKSNIDRLFREGLNNSAPHAFNEAAWDNMSSMLNEREKLSWLSLGKLASAALFLSTLFVGSNIPDVGLLATSEAENPRIEINSTRTVVDKPLLAANNLEGKRFKADTKNSPVPSTRSDFSSSPEGKGDYEASAIGGAAPNSNEFVAIEDLAIDNSENIASLEENAKSVIDSEYESNLINSITINKITPNSVKSINIESEDYSFDPVDQTTMPKLNIQSLSVFAGITLENGLGSASQLSANNLLYTAGFYYNIAATENLSFSTGLGYRSKSGKGIELSRTQTEYGFGKSETTETLTLNRLHYVDLPIEVQYNIKGKHSVIAGASLSYLAGVKSAFATTHEESLQSSTTSSENTWDYEDGLNKLDAGIRVGYDYSLNQNFSIGGMVQYGLMDITSNETFEIQDNSNNMEVRVTLKYTPFRF